VVKQHEPAGGPGGKGRKRKKGDGDDDNEAAAPGAGALARWAAAWPDVLAALAAMYEAMGAAATGDGTGDEVRIVDVCGSTCNQHQVCLTVLACMTPWAQRRQ
jgi:hypothetical protein